MISMNGLSKSKIEMSLHCVMQFVPPLDKLKWLSAPLSSFAQTNFQILCAKPLSILTGPKEHLTSLKRFSVSSLLAF